MPKTTLAAKIDYQVADKVKKYCRECGIKYGFFVEKALEERLERKELKEDLLDLKTLQTSEKEAIPFEDYLKKRRA